jgi:DNA helicase-2/ATP-dependent DNA helicase PcrA
MELREEGTSLNEIAVLYRSHFHALELQLELTRRQIPFSITSGIRFFEQAHIKDATAYLKFVANPRDEISFKRLVQLLPGVASKGADKLWHHFSLELTATQRRNEAVTTGEAAPAAEPPATSTRATKAATNRSENNPERRLKWPIAAALQDAIAAVPKKAVTDWAQFSATISQLEDESVRQNPGKMLKLVLDAGYKEYLQENYDNHERRLNDLQELGGFAVQFGNLEEFLTQLSLLTNVEAEDNAPKDGEDRLRLTTIHQAKGLEFDVVFVIMLCDGLFPSGRSSESPDGEEEERRLFYVSITRAKNELYLSYPMMRAGFGSTGVDAYQSPSRFLAEIPANLINIWNLR